MSVPSSVTGLWGEAIVARELRRAGWAVDWDGGMSRGHDLRATRDGQVVHVQVKTTTAPDGRIAWTGDGSRARTWSESVNDLGASALFALVHMRDSAETDFDLDRGVLTVRLPENYSISRVPAQQFADDVDAARTQYGSRMRKVRGPNGEAVGTKLSADGLRYPVLATDYTAWEEL